MNQGIKPGRRRLDPAATREAILESAFQVFSAKGFAGASIAEIAAAAGVPKSLVQYHFGNKEDLWTASLQAKAAPMLEAIGRMAEGEGMDTAGLIKARFRLYQSAPDVARALAWVSLGLAPSPGFLPSLRERLLRGLGPDHSAEDVLRLLLAVAATDGWFLYRNLYRSVAGEGIFEPDVEERLLTLLQGLVTGSPAPRSLEGPDARTSEDSAS